LIELLQRRPAWWQASTAVEPPLTPVPDLRIGRLRLVAIAPSMLAAEQASDAPRLMQLLRAQLTEQWPPADWQPHVYTMILKQYAEWPHSFGWHRYVLLSDGFGRKTLIGAVGGFPKPHGDVEIGYSTLPAFQRRGYGTAFACKLVDWLLTRDGVLSVSAQAYPHVSESIKLMQRCGMTPVGEGDDPGTVRFRRMR
jgi:ribosomal-protein-alanine N-acetyltransferase